MKDRLQKIIFYNIRDVGFHMTVTNTVIVLKILQ